MLKHKGKGPTNGKPKTEQNPRGAGKPVIPALIRFYNSISFDARTGCWEWDGIKNKGAGVFWTGSKLVQASRYSYELKNGTIPERLIVVQKCHNRCCINPEHLVVRKREVIDWRKSLIFGLSRARLQHAKTHCPHGHPYDVTGTVMLQATWPETVRPV